MLIQHGRARAGWGWGMPTAHRERGPEALRALPKLQSSSLEEGKSTGRLPSHPGPGLKVQSSGGLADVEYFRRH